MTYGLKKECPILEAAIRVGHHFSAVLTNIQKHLVACFWKQNVGSDGLLLNPAKAVLSSDSNSFLCGSVYNFYCFF